MKPVLVTGATGFLGVNVLKSLHDASAGGRVRCLVRTTGYVSSVPSGSEVVTGDVTEPTSLETKFRGIHTVVHLASKVLAHEPSEYWQVNVQGTRNVVEQCTKEGVEHIIYVSSAAIYGFDIARDVEEYDPREVPVTPVSRSRYEAEKVLMEYHRRGNIKVTILRPLFVYGDGDRFFIPSILRTLLRFPFMINRGIGRFSVISARELGGTIVQVLEADLPATGYPVYHATDGVPVSLDEVVRTLCDEFHLKHPSFSLPYHIAVRAMALVGLKKLLFSRFSGDGSGEARDVSSIELRHRIHLVSYDHYYSNRRLVAAFPQVIHSSFAKQFRSYTPYYRSVLSEMTRSHT